MMYNIRNKIKMVSYDQETKNKDIAITITEDRSDPFYSISSTLFTMIRGTQTCSSNSINGYPT